MDNVARRTHEIVCPRCARPFDLFAARWCTHPERSKLCPHCDCCACEHPAYREPRFWKEAPLGFKRRGFQRLFLYYL